MYESTKSFDYNVGSHINCFALNSQANRVVVAANNLQMLKIGTTAFEEINSWSILDSYATKIMDISWSKRDEGVIVCGGSTGVLYKYKVTESNMALEKTFGFYNQSIKKVALHPSKANELLTASQDAKARLIDLNSYTEALTFTLDNEDKVTDLQFNPKPGKEWEFACGTWQGCIYIWDIRKPGKSRKIIGSHMKSVCLDYHPELDLLATGSIDKTRKLNVWNMKNIFEDKEKAVPVSSLTHSEVISCVKWRPERASQIAACSTDTLAHLHVWDFKRPFVPYASFEDLTNKIRNFVWRDNPNVLIAASKTQLHNRTMNDAVRPGEKASLVSVEMNKCGSLAFTKAIEGESQENWMFEPRVTGMNDTDDLPDSIRERLKLTKSILYEEKIDDADCSWFCYAAAHYKFKTDQYEQTVDNSETRNDAFEELCEHNAQVAKRNNRIKTYKNWQILKTIYKDVGKYETDESKLGANNLPNEPTKYSDLHIQIPFNPSLQKNLNVSSSSSNQSINNSSSLSDFVSDESNNLLSTGIMTNMTGNEDDLNVDYSLVEDSSQPGVMIKGEMMKRVSDNYTNKQDDEDDCLPSDSVQYTFGTGDDDLLFNDQKTDQKAQQKEQQFAQSPTNEMTTTATSVHQMQKNQQQSRATMNRAKKNKIQSNAYSFDQLTNMEDQSFRIFSSASNMDEYSKTGSGGGAGSNNLVEKFTDLTRHLSNQTALSNSGGLLSMDFDRFFYDTLLNYVNEENDLTTAVFMFLVANLHGKFDKSKIDSIYLDEWMANYIELLAKFELWNKRIEILKAYQSDFVNSLAQKSITYTSMCSSCKKTIPANSYLCIECRRNVFLCVYCHLPVKRLYAWCYICCHGGHMNHIVKWFENNTKCPSGCGCTCVREVKEKL